MTSESYLLTLKGPSKKTYKSLSKWFPGGSISVVCMDVEDSKSFRFTVDSETVKNANIEAGVENFENSLEESFKIGSEKYEIIVDQENFIKWKAIGERGFKLTLGQFPIKYCDFKDAVSEIFMSSTREIGELRLKNKEKTEELAKVKSLVHEYEERFEKAIEEKKNLEEELFGQFLPILNSKKRKIRQLLDLDKSTEVDEQGRDLVAPHTMSDSGDEDDADSSSSVDNDKTVDSQNFLNLSSI